MYTAYSLCSDCRKGKGRIRIFCVVAQNFDVVAPKMRESARNQEHTEEVKRSMTWVYFEAIVKEEEAQTRVLVTDSRSGCRKLKKSLILKIFKPLGS